MPYASGLELFNYFQTHKTISKKIEVKEIKKDVEHVVVKSVAKKAIDEVKSLLKAMKDEEGLKTIESIIKSEPSFQKKNSDKYLVRRQSTGMVTVKVPDSEYLTVTHNKGVVTITKSTSEDLKTLAKPVIRKRKIKEV